MLFRVWRRKCLWRCSIIDVMIVRKVFFKRQLNFLGFFLWKCFIYHPRSLFSYGWIVRKKEMYIRYQIGYPSFWFLQLGHMDQIIPKIIQKTFFADDCCSWCNWSTVGVEQTVRLHYVLWIDYEPDKDWNILQSHAKYQIHRITNQYWWHLVDKYK